MKIGKRQEGQIGKDRPQSGNPIKCFAPIYRPWIAPANQNKENEVCELSGKESFVNHSLANPVKCPKAGVCDLAAQRFRSANHIHSRDATHANSFAGIFLL